MLALTGQATLWMAVFADMGASLLVVFNGLRLIRVFSHPEASRTLRLKPMTAAVVDGANRPHQPKDS